MVMRARREAGEVAKARVVVRWRRRGVRRRAEEEKVGRRQARSGIAIVVVGGLDGRWVWLRAQCVWMFGQGDTDAGCKCDGVESQLGSRQIKEG